jgi:serine protease Do
MERFFGQTAPDRENAPQGRGRERRQTQTSLGSGFVIDKDGYILTNRHVIEGADKIQVTFPGGKTYDAKIVGRDARTDVGLLKVDATEPLTVLALGDSDKTEVEPRRSETCSARRQQRHRRRRLVRGATSG